MCKSLRLQLAFVVALVLNLHLAYAEPLPSDPALVAGELDNGLRYVVRHCDKPEGRAIVWIHMHTGSMNETDRQRGIAHYLEHMAFNGSANFPPSKLVPFFESMGMTFGRDQNAFTNMQETTYQLSLPKADKDTLTKGMTFFADVVSRLSLLPAEVDNERQIILEERRRGLGAQQRVRDFIMERSFPGSLFGHRMTIGLESTIKGVNEQDFRDYYGKWYCPSNATVMVVADADPKDVIAIIKDQFGDEPKKPRPTPQAMNIKAYDKSFAIVATDPEIRSGDVRITRVAPAYPAVTTVERWVENLTQDIGESAMNHRLGEKSNRGDQPYLNSRVSVGDSAVTVHEAEISARCRPGKWQASLEAIATELQRARAFGFTQKEIDRVKKDLISNAERAVEPEGTIEARPLMTRLNGSVGSGNTILSPQQRLDLLKKHLPTITPESIARKFADEFDPKAVAVVVVLPSGDSVPSESQVLEIATKALDAKPTQEADDEAQLAQLMSQPPTPGTVVEQADHNATKVWSGWLSNGVRVHHKFIDEQKDQVSVSIALLGGTLLETPENRGITSVGELAWSRPATEHLTSAQIREFMTGRKVSVRGGGFGGFGGGRGGGRRGGGGGGGGGDAITISINGRPNELETGFQLAYLLLTEPKIEASAFEQWQTAQRQRLSEEITEPQQIGNRLVTAARYPEGEVRVRPLTIEQVDRLTLAAGQAWMEKLIKESPIEMTIVGDISKEKAIELATEYVGSLPNRPRVEPKLYSDLRKLQRPTGARIIEKEANTETDQAYVYNGFYGADESNREDVRGLTMASRILSTRMTKQVREEAQLVYSIGAQSAPATTYPGFGAFSASATTDPHKASALAAKLTSMWEEFARNGPSDDEVDIAKKQFQTTWTETIKQPAFWSAQLSQITFRGRNLDEVMQAPEQYEALTAKQVKDTFAKYYSKDNSIVVVVKPKGSGPTTKTAHAGD